VVDPAPQIPAGEEPRQEFPPDEILYLRIPPLDPDDEDLDVVTLEDIPSLPFSVNRGSLSIPEDVIENYPGWGIVSFPVSAVPAQLVSPGNVVYEFRLIPRVESGNRAHVDIRVFKEDGQEITDNRKMNGAVKALFRENIRRKADLVRKPDREPPSGLATR
jgi:hypothetical protein